MNKQKTIFPSFFHASIDEPVRTVQYSTIAAVKRLLYSVRQCEKMMPSNSFGMMRKALYSVGL